MKKISKIILLSALLTTTIWSCKKDENKIYFTGGTAPVLSANKSAIILSFVNKDQEALKLIWTNPNYKFTTGLSSQSVSYQIEVDTTGANFTNPTKKTIALSSDLSITFTQSELNTILFNELKLVAGIPHNIEIRVTSYLANSSVPLTSNVLKFTGVTPYVIPPKVAPPTTGRLFIVGSATNGDWNNPVPVPSQEFTKLSPTLYEITIALKGGQEYLFLPLNGDWGHKFAVPDNTINGLSAGGDFKFDAKDNFPGPAASGTYKITVDFQSGIFTVTKL